MNTMQILLSVFTVLGYAVGHLHAWLASPVGQDVLKAAAQVQEHTQLLQGHAKLQKIAQGGAAIVRVLPAIDAALHEQASGQK